MRYTAAAVQFEPRFGEKAANVERLIQLTREAVRAGARLVVLPEMATTGYCFRSREEIAPLVESVPGGPTMEAFGALAAELGIYIVVGLAEVETATGAYYNTAALVGPHGLVGKYRKTHAYVDETRWARDGDLGIPVFETELGRIAMLICMDADYMEPPRVAALGGADVIAFPTNWLGEQTIWRARSLENGVYMICANRWGEERGARFCGHSVIVDPTGVALNLLSEGDGLVLAEVDTDRSRAARTMALSARRPGQYQELLLSSHLWHWREGQMLPTGRPAVVAVGEATEASRMADQVRWADKQARDREWASLDLVVFPLCERRLDPAPLADAARMLQCYIAWGAPDEDGFNCAWLMGPDGMVGYGLQLHTGDGAPSAGGGFALFDLPFGRLGLLVGADLQVPEAARILAKRGADLIAAPAAWAGEYDRLLWRARCMENDTPLAVANRQGGSRVYQPGATVQMTREVPGGVALSLVETGSEAVRAKELLRKLQPRWYGALVEQA
jgi:predicted amidohydrolase